MTAALIGAVLWTWGRRTTRRTRRTYTGRYRAGPGRHRITTTRPPARPRPEPAPAGPGRHRITTTHPPARPRTEPAPAGPWTSTTRLVRPYVQGPARQGPARQNRPASPPSKPVRGQRCRRAITQRRSALRRSTPPLPGAIRAVSE
jgi:hypothetical protein